MTPDLVLSSGFLAFGRHLGVLDALVESGVETDGVVGVSSGALIGSLWANGLSPDAIVEALGGRSPLSQVGTSWAPWRGLFTLDPGIARLRELLPASFGELKKPFGCGVATLDGRFELVTDGDLPAAVMASCAVPWLFCPVTLEGIAYQDGAVVDRLGWRDWLAHRGPRPLITHNVASTSGAPTEEPEGVVIRTPRSTAKFWSVASLPDDRAEARALAAGVLGSD